MNKYILSPCPAIRFQNVKSLPFAKLLHLSEEEYETVTSVKDIPRNYVCVKFLLYIDLVLADTAVLLE